MESILQNIEKLSHAHLHLYGKKEAKPKRKMGHVTVLAEDVDAALKMIDSWQIWNDRRLEHV
jgi:5-(carboxyamino)imidazole ribonucleotide synthase